MLPADDPARRFYEELLLRFGSDDVVVIALIGDALFTPEGLDALIRATEALADGAPRPSRGGAADGAAHPARGGRRRDRGLLRGSGRQPGARRRAAPGARRGSASAPAASSPVTGGRRRSLVTFERMPEDEFLARNVDLATLAVAQEAVGESAGLRVVMAGTPHVKAEVGRLLTTELTVMVPIVLVLMAGALVRVLPQRPARPRAPGVRRARARLDARRDGLDRSRPERGDDPDSAPRPRARLRLLDPRRRRLRHGRGGDAFRPRPTRPWPTRPSRSPSRRSRPRRASSPLLGNGARGRAGLRACSRRSARGRRCSRR